MNLPAVTVHLEIAKVGGGFVVQYHTNGPAGSIAIDDGTVYLKSRDELSAWMANVTIRIP